MSKFDTTAADWDKNDIHWKRSMAIKEAITKNIPLSKRWKALDFGAGTGILGFMLSDKVQEMFMMDNSVGMVKMTQQKIDNSQESHVHAILHDLTKSDYTENKFDLIFSQMAFHHILDLNSVIPRFFKMMNSGGYIAIADLYSEDGSFHGKDVTDVHKGFDPEELGKLFVKYGFIKPYFETCFRMEKETVNGKTENFPLFLLVVKKE